MNYREMARLAQDPAGIRGVAKMIMTVVADELSEKSHSFLSDLQSYDGSRPLSTRQLETLYALRERSTRRPTAGRYRAAVLFKLAFEQRFDLPDVDDEEWLETQHARGPEIAISAGEWRRLIALCKDLGIIERAEWVEI